MKELSPSTIKRINESKTIEDLREKLKIENDQDIFKLLLTFLDLLVEKYDNQYKETSYKIIDFLEVLAGTEINNLINKCVMITDEKQKITNILENDCDNLKDKEKTTLKELARKLEALRTNISFNINSLSIIENYNIVKQILFKEKNRDLSLCLIKNNSYFIDVFNKSNDNILLLITKVYLNAIEQYAKDINYYDLSYYDEILDEILTNDKIKKDKKVIEKCIETVINYDKRKNKTGSEYNKAVPWYKNLEKKLDNFNYEEDIEKLNELYKISKYFKKSLIDEGNKSGKKEIQSNRYKKNKDHILTIDNNFGFEKEDAISIEKKDNIYKLKIFISDPNSFFDKYGLLMEEARKRVEVVYFNHKPVGIFPKEIIRNYLSLEKNCNRLVRVYEFDIGESGILIDFKISKQIINVDKCYSYDEFNQSLVTPKSKKEEKIMENIVDLYNIINKKYIINNCNDNISAEQILEVFMLFTNNKVAELFSHKGVPFVYKCNSNNNQDIELLLKNIDEEYNNYKGMIKTAIKSAIDTKYSVERQNHDGLGFSAYCHCTSPMHNYADILVNECEDLFYFNNASDEEAEVFEEYLKEEVDYINGKISFLNRYKEKSTRARVRSKNKK